MSGPELNVGGDWDQLPLVASGGRRLSVRRADGDASTDSFVAVNSQNDTHPAEGRWAEWVALARAILAHDDERNAKRVTP